MQRGHFLELRYWVLSALQRIAAPEGRKVNAKLENLVTRRLSEIYRQSGYLAVDASDSAVRGGDAASVLYEPRENAVIMNVPYEMWRHTARKPFVVAELQGSGEISFNDWLKRLDSKDRDIITHLRESGYAYEVHVGERKLNSPNEKFSFEEARRGGVWIYKKV